MVVTLVVSLPPTVTVPSVLTATGKVIVAVVVPNVKTIGFEVAVDPTVTLAVGMVIVQG